MTWIPDTTLQHLRGALDQPDLSGTRYAIVDRIGQGGMGTVYEVEDIELGRRVALKVLRDPDVDARAAQRIVQEARIIAQLEHPGIVPVHDVGRLPDGRVYYVMKLVRGKRLDEHFDADAPLASRLRLFERICQTVAFAHAHGVIHRDLKPQNIMVGEFGEVLVLDWGVAKWIDAERSSSGNQSESPGGMEQSATDAATESHRQSSGDIDPDATQTRQTQQGTIVGTPAYMAPEQARGDIEHVDRRADVYALGALLYYLLTGQAPPSATAMSTQTPEAQPPRPRSAAASTPRAIDAICRKALDNHPEQRYPTAENLAEDISRFLAGQAVIALPEGPIGRLIRFANTYKVPILLVGAYLVMRIVIFLITGPNEPPRGAEQNSDGPVPIQRLEGDDAP